MRFNQHLGLADRHAFLSPSKYHWLNYDYQKLEARYWAHSASRRGTDLHALAHEAIRLGVPLDPSNEAMASYVNDAIELGMRCEQPLYFSENAFGTADTIKFEYPNLHIHDLKTGITPVKETQLEVYAALFCLEYDYDPFELVIELRIYQRADVFVFEPRAEGIQAIMERLQDFDQFIETLKED